ncbi:MAG: glutamate--tRNA ligase [Pseudomonadota bacterium]|jgi:glutamyl-tRNA synthetase|nr:glutamate--tRNA ligase [Pseudomonadota bacterium]MEC7701525.1 glutamate--tRNA ligase [Pseudomonadota bacterium]MEC9236409.1 glutamate--tRNA ligase [Pseudomonadota bacterium]
MSEQNVKVRFAPSPTGMMHVGNARTALITWLFARSQQGKFLLRIDDTDQERSKKEYEDAIVESLKWLGVDWDENARQRDRLDRYDECIEKLKSEGRIYACYETADELALKRKVQLNRGMPPIYDRAALELTDADKQKFEAEGRTPHWRFKLNHTPIVWNDHVRGEVSFKGEDLSDPVVIREDGSPLYHLCSVIDDVDYGITHIVRGEDHVSNTATHIQMFEALGAKVPDFAHLPLLSDGEGGKLSKRLGSLSIIDIRDDDGLEAMAVVSLMSRLGTSDPIEAFTDVQPIIDSFSFSKFGRGTPKFDPNELLRLNKKILHETSYAAVKDRIGIAEMDEEFWNTIRPNLNKLSDANEWWHVINGPVTPVIEDAEYIEAAASLLPEAPWSEDTWKAWTDAIKAETGRKGKELFMPLRQALTGMAHGPEMAFLLPLIGAERTLNRLQAKKAA